MKRDLHDQKGFRVLTAALWIHGAEMEACSARCSVLRMTENQLKWQVSVFPGTTEKMDVDRFVGRVFVIHKYSK